MTPLLQHRRGFTVTEVLLAVAVMSLIMAGAASVYFMCGRSYWISDVNLRAARATSLALQRITYGIYGSNGLRSAHATGVVVTASSNGWTLDYDVPDGTHHAIGFDSTRRQLLYTNTLWAGHTFTLAVDIASASMAHSNFGGKVTVVSTIQEGRFAATNTLSSYIHYRN